MKRGQRPELTSIGKGFSKYTILNPTHPRYSEHMVIFRKNKTKYGLRSMLLPYPDELKEAIAENKKKTALDI